MLSPRLVNFAFDTYTNLWGRTAGALSPAIGLPPLVLRLRITNRCNLSCHYCYVGSSLNQKVSDPLTLVEWKKIIDSVPAMSLIDITGGEPFLAPHFSEIMNHMLDRKLKVSVITNGTIKNESLLKEICRKKLSHFMVSLDGPQDIHDEVRGKGSFAKAIETTRFVIAERKRIGSDSPMVVAKITLTGKSSGKMPEFVKFLLEEIGFDGVTINLLFDNDSRNGFAEETTISDEKFSKGNKINFAINDIPLMNEALEKVFASYSDKVQIRPKIERSQIRKYFENPSGFSPSGCYKYRSVATIYNDGTITPCDIGLDVGNIREIGYQVSGMMRGQEMTSFFGFMKKKKSENFPGCGGCCLKAHQFNQ